MDENKKEDFQKEKWIEVEAVCQYPALPTGCEVTAASMFLSWLLHLRDSQQPEAQQFCAPSSSSSSSSSSSFRDEDANENSSNNFRPHLPKEDDEDEDALRDWQDSLRHLTEETIDRSVLAETIVKEPDPVVFAADGRRRGGDPHRAFVGEPTSRASFGTFHEPIYHLLDDERYIKGLVVDLTPRIQAALTHALPSKTLLEEGSSLPPKRTEDDNDEVVEKKDDDDDDGGEEGDENKEEEDGEEDDERRRREEVAFAFLQECIDDGRPVIVWMTLELRPPRVTDEWDDYRDYDEEEEDGDGEEEKKEKPRKTRRVIRWTSPEHCALLVGYSPTAVFINDPHTGRRERYDRRLFLRRWLHMGTQAVTLRPLHRPLEQQ